MFSSSFPDRLKNEDDAQMDYTAPPSSNNSRDGMQYMQQSVLSLIAAVGSRTDPRARFDDSSDSEEEETRTKIKRPSAQTSDPANTAPPEADGTLHVPSAPETRSSSKERGRRHRRSISDPKLFRPFKSGSINQDQSYDSSPCPEPSTGDRLSPFPDLPRPRSATPRAVPILSRMVEARALLEVQNPAERPQASLKENNDSTSQQQSQVSPLSVQLMEMFGFTAPEKVVVEYACSLLQNMLLQGYMYVTEGHICFYAYLPRQSTKVIKSGYIHKRGRKSPKYNRYWFSLKEDVLSYYADPSNLYFPSGQIDLRYGISASLAESKEKGRESRDFQVTTDHRTYYFRADSSVNAKEWVRALQKVIFRTHNEGESIKVSFPVENILDVEESPMVEFAQTFKIRVVESEETYAIDEHYFTFFDSDSGRRAFDLLRGLIRGTPTKSTPSPSPIPDGAAQSRRPRGSQNRWSMTSGSKPQGSSTRRRRSASTSILGSDTGIEMSPRRQEDSSSSFFNSIDQVTESSAVLQSMTDTTESASQILNRSDVFQSPTIHNWQQRTSGAAEPNRRHSDEMVRSITEHALDGLSIAREGPEMQYAGSDSEQDSKDASRLYSAVDLNDLVRAGTYPLKRAAGIAGYLKTRSKEMSSLLATESMGYIEKVSGMWAGGRRHYGTTDGLLPDDRALYPETAEESMRDAERFRTHFALPPTEKLEAAYFAYLHRALPLYGKIYISQNRLCFRSLLIGTRTKMILPLRDIENVEKEKGFQFGYHGLVVVIRGHEELFFEFNAADARDDCAVTLHQRLESAKFLAESASLSQQENDVAEAAKMEHRMLQEARQNASAEHDLRPGLGESSELHSIFDDPRASIVNFKPTEPLRITCLTIGSRGDVQPYIALCKGLLAEGHKPKIATHAEFEPWVRKHGIDFAPVDGDPAELMRLCVENGMFTYSFLKEATAKFRGWIDDLLSSAWRACQGSDLLIESPSAMAGIHVAEALRIPYFRGFTMPWSRTRAYPHAFAVPESRLGGAYNYITYVMFENVFWRAISGQVNRWRMNELGLKATNLDKMQPNKVPFLYNFSPSVVPPPLDFPDWVRITGYWFLSESTDWTPPKELAEFIQRARQDGKKIVYIGFGSIVVSDPSALTRTVVESVQKADVRCILSKGWSARLGDPTSTQVEIPLPPEIHQIQSAPHDWLFSQIDAAAHHGGAGTTGASLRAGVPTIIKPFFGDQFFFGNRVEDLGVGVCMKKLNVSVFSRALWTATHDERMIVRAKQLGERIRSEDGVATAIQAIYRDLEYATTLTRQRLSISATPFSPTPSAKTSDDQNPDDDIADIEDWTFVGDESDLEYSRRARDRAVSGADNLPERFVLGSRTNFADS
ncbi:UDP-glucose:sterol glycosyltransferase [Aspergillus mulundensis]|uniref:Sterol 3-beta-glucosyltransferase n=1 Tax=Aspergillus mulundensis TaxID=1810919 RepID=A0A3D8RE97_9EURO|nr:Sterol 3-beta-glucosyltransferase [Aspergillus mulundensis]RDW72300.1 Sterol 3-beta-glucosyltransferase [Aspergillus mulundensis]